MKGKSGVGERANKPVKPGHRASQKPTLKAQRPGQGQTKN
jgi:hypothetical protein